MSEYKRVIHLRETDATEVIYFAELPSIAMEAFQNFLKEQDLSLRKIFDDGQHLIPIVHSEVDFYKPLKVGDEIVVKLSLGGIGEKSFFINYAIFRDGELAGRVMIKHVFVDKKSFESILVPPNYRKLLQEKLPSA